MQNKFIAYCGLNCEKCEARIATINNDNKLREKVAKEWGKMNGMEFKPEWINCEGCKFDGVKCAFCDSMCEIRKCATSNKYDTCISCNKKNSCEKLNMITGHNEEARKNLDIKK